MIPLLLVLMLFTVSSCTASRGFDRQALTNLLHADPDVVTERDIAAVLGVRVESVAPRRSALIRKGMIYSPAHGDTAFTVPLFDQFMQRAMP